MKNISYIISIITVNTSIYKLVVFFKLLKSCRVIRPVRTAFAANIFRYVPSNPPFG